MHAFTFVHQDHDDRKDDVDLVEPKKSQNYFFSFKQN